MGHDDAERGIDLERLGIFPSPPADRRVPGVADADVPRQAQKIISAEDVPNEAVPLLCVEATVVGDDSSRILPPVLDRQEPLVKVTEDIRVAEKTDDTAHLFFNYNIKRGRTQEEAASSKHL